MEQAKYFMYAGAAAVAGGAVYLFMTSKGDDGLVADLGDAVKGAAEAANAALMPLDNELDKAGTAMRKELDKDGVGWLVDAPSGADQTPLSHLTDALGLTEVKFDEDHTFSTVSYDKDDNITISVDTYTKAQVAAMAKAERSRQNVMALPATIKYGQTYLTKLTAILLKMTYTEVVRQRPYIQNAYITLMFERDPLVSVDDLTKNFNVIMDNALAVLAANKKIHTAAAITNTK